MYSPISYLVLIIILFIVFSAYFIYQKKLIHKLIIQFIEWFIQRNYSTQFVHVDRIKDKAVTMIADTKRILNEQRDRIEADKLQAQALNFKIMEAGWVATIEELERELKKLLDWKKDTQQLYFDTKLQAAELKILTSRNESEVKKVIQSMTDPLGRLSAISNDLVQIDQKNIKDETKSLEILNINDIKNIE